MTGGTVIILGKTGRNFGAGMSGGVAYVYDEDGSFAEHCNTDMVGMYPVDDEQDCAMLLSWIKKHVATTDSALGRRIADDFDARCSKFIKVMPHDYRRALEAMQEVEAAGMSGDDAVMAAFEKNVHDPSRVSGN